VSISSAVYGHEMSEYFVVKKRSNLRCYLKRIKCGVSVLIFQLHTLVADTHRVRWINTCARGEMA